MTGLLAAESIKLFKRWLYWVMVFIYGSLLGLSGLVLLVLPTLGVEGLGELPRLTKSTAYLLGAQQAIGQTWFPAVLVATAVGGEVASGIWAAELTRESRRFRHLVAKLMVLTGAGWLAALLGVAGWALLTAIFVEGSGTLPGSEWWGIVWKAAVVDFTWVALGLGAVGLLRSVGPAIGAVLGLSLGDGVLALWEPWRVVSIGANQAALLGNLALEGGFGIPTGNPIPFTRALVVVIVWALVAIAAAVTFLQWRDP